MGMTQHDHAEFLAYLAKCTPALLISIYHKELWATRRGDANPARVDLVREEAERRGIRV